MIYWPDLYNLQTAKKTAKNVTTSWNWPIISHYCNPPILTLPINLRYSEIRAISCRPDLHSLQTRKESE